MSASFYPINSAMSITGLEQRNRLRGRSRLQPAFPTTDRSLTTGEPSVPLILTTSIIPLSEAE
jgi:hypothetical protein